MATTWSLEQGLQSADSDPIKSIETFYVRPRWLFVKVATEKGVVGWGEATLEGVYAVVDVVFTQFFKATPMPLKARSLTLGSASSDGTAPTSKTSTKAPIDIVSTVAEKS